MSDGAPVLRRIDWSEVCPWLILFRSFRLSISIPVLFLATVGTLLTPLGWMASSALFIRPESHRPEFVDAVAANSEWPAAVMAEPRSAARKLTDLKDWIPDNGLRYYFDCVPGVYCGFIDPFAQLANSELKSSQIAYYLFGGIWNIGIWAFVGGAITRLAAVQLGRDERLSLRKAISHARRNLGWYMAAPFFPMLGIVLIAAPILILGLAMRTAIGTLVAGLFWPLVLVAGFVMAVLLIGLACGWPLMWPTISCEEGSDAFEAFSRSFSYTYQRPLQYFFCVAITVVVGALGWFFVSTFCLCLLQLTEGVASWGAGGERVRQLLSGDNEGLLWFGAQLINLAETVAQTIAVSFRYGFFFCVSTAVYLLLRRAVDQTDFDEVFLEDEEQRYGLPDLDPGNTSP
jgi:hypothetical protein